MGLVPAVVLCLALLYSVLGATIDHDKVQPFAQPDPVTISEQAAVKYKPRLLTGGSCVSFHAVNAAGDITGGLKGTKGTDACTEAPLGSQVYGRAMWYQDKWAMMYSWYFPKNFWGGEPESCHLWANMVLWLDNPAWRLRKSSSDDSSWIGLGFWYEDGQYQDLIMWNQVTVEARMALESADFGEDTEVPFNDKNFETSLAEAWPF